MLREAVSAIFVLWVGPTFSCGAKTGLHVPSRDASFDSPPEVATPDAGECGVGSTEPDAPVWNQCEGPICGTWRWDSANHRFDARWTNGAVAHLTLDRFDDCQVLLHRQDYAGASRGLTAAYTGTRNGRGVSGSVTWTSEVDGRMFSGTWSATW